MAEPAKILVVDDEDDVRELVQRLLRAAGYLTDVARTGAEAVDKVRSARPDLVVLDLMMPVVDGWGVLDALQQSADPPPVVVLTVRDDREAFTRAVSKGAVAYISKPFRFGDVLSTCRRALRARAAPRVAVVPERRQSPRRLLLAAVTVYSHEKHPMALGQLVDLSPGGVKVELGLALPALSRIFISFQGRGLSMTLEGRVQWTKTAELDSVAHGLSFLELLPEQRRLVHELLSLTVPD